jgi:hypothetical protein
MKNLAHRVEECLAEYAVRENVKVSAARARLAKAVGIKTPSIYDWTNGKTKQLSGGNLNRASAFFQVSPKWFETGDGPKYIAESTEDAVASDPFEALLLRAIELKRRGVLREKDQDHIANNLSYVLEQAERSKPVVTSKHITSVERDAYNETGQSQKKQLATG